MSHEPHEGMSMHASARTPATGPAAGGMGNGDDIHANCIQRTASALLESEGASDTEVETAVAHCREARAQGNHFELLELVARVQGHDEEFMGTAILTLAESVAGTMANPPTLVPFAGKLIAPNAFYAAFPELQQACRDLLCPAIYAEDSDAIGVASINPVATILVAERIARIVHERNGIRPFISTVRMDYESWCFLTRKHFER